MSIYTWSQFASSQMTQISPQSLYPSQLEVFGMHGSGAPSEQENSMSPHYVYGVTVVVVVVGISVVLV